MILVLRTREDIARIKDFLSNRKHQKQFDAKKFNGQLKVDKDALVIQRQLRDEWN